MLSCIWRRVSVEIVLGLAVNADFNRVGLDGGVVDVTVVLEFPVHVGSGSGSGSGSGKLTSVAC